MLPGGRVLEIANGRAAVEELSTGPTDPQTPKKTVFFGDLTYWLEYDSPPLYHCTLHPKRANFVSGILPPNLTPFDLYNGRYVID